ncbi:MULTISPECIES: anti-sigma factor [Gordonia]|uniref:Regulator of SigK n=1 Tax=Gordonia sputi NBRC 100414 TaxID=1089453 RepID=H5U627_9ACTN|nr:MULTISPECIES: anti-sigma factor [Gordonia]NKY91913.1 anti-sigma factor [Gordonia sputi]OBA43290.1 anti-sigma factor [Gordonia sp. 852002-51296_SCH5728562-b]GAB41185.1 anti-sigma-K factor RskA [Gordonia sputi NBRC 100414]
MADTEWLDDHVELYAIDALTPAETERVRRELDDLSAVELRIYLARITDIQSAITDLASGFALAAPAELRATVLDRAFSADPESVSDTEQRGVSDTEQRGVSDTEQPGTAESDSEPGTAESNSEPSAVVPIDRARSRRGRAALAVGAAAVAVAVALGAGVLIGRTTAPEQTPSSTTAQQVSDILAAPDARSTVSSLADNRGTITVVSSKSANRAVAVVRDQRNPIAADQTFQLWLIGKAATPVSAGLVAGTGSAAPHVIDSLDDSSVLAVTIEPQGGSPQPTTDILTQVAL